MDESQFVLFDCPALMLLGQRSEVRGLGFSRGSESVNMSVHLYSLDAFEEKTLDVITFHQPAVVNKVNSSSL